jgi:hypothetical protein
VGCVADLPRREFDRTAARVETVYARARQLGNLHGAWLAALVRCSVASEAVNLVDAVAWTRRVLDLQARLGSGGSKVFLEALANGLTGAGRYEAATRVYAATQAQARRAGSGWPEHPRTAALFAEVRAHLSAPEFDRAWHDGAQHSLSDLVQDLQQVV